MIEIVEALSNTSSGLIGGVEGVIISLLNAIAGIFGGGGEV